MKRQFSASVYILDEEKQQVLLLFHKKMQKWLPAGGHIDPNETPPEAAIREAKEETGLEIELIKQENLWLNYHNARSIERPFFCLVEEIPKFGDEPAHQHIDSIFVGRPVGGKLIWNSEESHDVKWFSWQQLQALSPEGEIFQETLDAINVVMNTFCPSPV